MSDESKPIEKALFSAKEEDVLKAAWHCLKSAPEVDINKLMERCDFKTYKTAVNTWSVIKKKLDLNASAASAAPSSTPKKAPAKKTKAAPQKHDQKTQADVDDEEASTDEDTFRSLKRVRKSAEKRIKTEQQDDDDDEV